MTQQNAATVDQSAASAEALQSPAWPLAQAAAVYATR